MNKPYRGKTSAFICTLPEETQNQIRKDLETYAEKQGFELEKDFTGDYIAMNGRFCDIEEIYH